MRKCLPIIGSAPVLAVGVDGDRRARLQQELADGHHPVALFHALASTTEFTVFWCETVTGRIAARFWSSTT